MSRRYSKHDSKQYSILVDEGGISELNNFLVKSFETVQFAGRTTDNTTLSFDSIASLFDYPNHDERRLVRITISCTNCTSDKEADLSISLGASYSVSSETIQYHFAYDDIDWGFRFDDELNKYLRELKPWYHYLARFSWFFGIPIIAIGIMVLYIGIDSSLKLTGHTGYLEYISNGEVKNPFGGFVISFSFLALSYLIDLIKKSLFPKTFVSLGKQKMIYKRKTKISYIVFGTIILGIIINIFSTWIYSG